MPLPRGLKDQPRSDTPRLHDTRSIDSRFTPRANEARFPDAPGNDGSGGVGPEFSIPDDRRRGMNGAPRGGRR